jgi:hypothetical protein
MREDVHRRILFRHFLGIFGKIAGNGAYWFGTNSCVL